MSDMLAVLWDFDGTLADTEAVWRQVEADLMASYGQGYPPELSEELTGVDTRETGRILAERIPGYPLTGDELSDLVVERVCQFINTHPLPFRPGAKELLDELVAAQVPLALVSASPGRVIHAAVAQLPAGTFRAVITSDEVAHIKPHPEGYLSAAAAIGVDPRACVVIEDSAVGIAAGQASGAVVVGVPESADIPARPRQVIIETLAGVSAADLQHCWREHNDGSAVDL